MIVLHATVIDLAATLSGFERTTSGVSSHYVVGKDGSVFQMVKEADRAWHAGESFWKGRFDINDYSIGIEMVNRNDGIDPWPDEQVNAYPRKWRISCEPAGLPSNASPEQLRLKSNSKWTAAPLLGGGMVDQRALSLIYS